ncbi:MAG: hypothetical protein ACC662_09390, partial [Planctomycetota bacterium]
MMILAGCRAGRRGEGTPGAGPRPAAGAGTAARVRRPIPRAVAQARLRLRALDTEGALARLDASRGLDASQEERSWLLAHVWAQTYAGSRARRAARTLPRGPFREALEASLDEDPAAALTHLQRDVIRTSPSPWVRLAAAYLAASLERDDVARTQARRALAGGLDYVAVDAHLVIGRLLVKEGRLAAARREAAAALAIEPTDVRAHLLAFAAARLDGAYEEAADRLLEAMALVEGRGGYAFLLAEMLREADDPALFARVRGRLAGTALARATPEHRALGALLAARTGNAKEAIEGYRAALASGAGPVPADRELRRLLMHQGEYASGLDLLARAVPPGLVDDPKNLQRGAWARLAAAGRAAPKRDGAPEPVRLELARALVGVGALEEARGVLSSCGGAKARALDGRLASQRAFEEALRDLVEGGYRRGHRHQPPPTFDALLVRMAEAARAHLSPDEAAAFQPPFRGVRRVPVLGAWLDHHARTASPAVRHFRRYGRYLVLGRRQGQPTEAVLFSLAYLRASQPISTRGVTISHDVAVGYDRSMRSFVSSQGADLGGACLPDSIWIDADSTREAEHDVRRGLELDPGRLAWARRSPVPLDPDGPGGVLGVSDMGGVGVRLLDRYAARHPDGGWGSFESLRQHEFGHVVELRRHLPLLRGLPATLVLLFESGFSPRLLEGELERRAQLAAVAFGPDPDLAVAEMVVTQPAAKGSARVHAGGFREALHRMAVEIETNPDRYPGV